MAMQLTYVLLYHIHVQPNQPKLQSHITLIQPHIPGVQPYLTPVQPHNCWSRSFTCFYIPRVLSSLSFSFTKPSFTSCWVQPHITQLQPWHLSWRIAELQPWCLT